MRRNLRLTFYRGAWCAVWTDNGKTCRRSMRTKVKETAARRFEDWRRQVEGGLIREAAARYLEDKQKEAIDPKHLHYAWRAAGSFFGHLRPNQITKRLCCDYIAQRRRRGYSDGSIRRELGVVRAALRYVGEASDADFYFPGRPAPQDRSLTQKEYGRLLKAAASPHIELFIILALATAGRVSAILELTWDRVDFQRGVIRLSTDDEQRRKGRATVPMTETGRKALRRAFEAAQSDYVIEYAGRRVQSIKHAFRRAAERAGLDGVSPNVIRHTAAVWMAENGRPIAEIAQYLGHRDSRITESVYARYSPAYLRKAAEALEFHDVPSQWHIDDGGQT